MAVQVWNDDSEKRERVYTIDPTGRDKHDEQ